MWRVFVYLNDMLELLKIVVLGVIQGVTEFLPISSSGHLVLTKYFLGFPSEGALLEVTLHAGTLIPILFYYRRRICELVVGVVLREEGGVRRIGYLVLATIPTGVVYLFIKDVLEGLYQSPRVPAIALCVTGLLMIIPVRRRSSDEPISALRAFLIGIGQAFAMIPGISRAGTTIIMARHMGIESKQAAEFSFLMAIPVLLAAVILEIPKLGHESMGSVTLGGIVVGIVTAAIVGYFSLLLLVRILGKGRFWIFGIYCILVGAGSLILQSLA